MCAKIFLLISLSTCWPSALADKGERGHFFERSDSSRDGRGTEIVSEPERLAESGERQLRKNAWGEQSLSKEAAVAQSKATALAVPNAAEIATTSDLTAIQKQARSVLDESKRAISLVPKHRSQMVNSSTDYSSLLEQNENGDKAKQKWQMQTRKDVKGNLTWMLHDDSKTKRDKLTPQQVGHMVLSEADLPHKKARTGNKGVAKRIIEEFPHTARGQRRTMNAKSTPSTETSFPNPFKFSPVQIGQMLSKDGEVITSDLDDAATLMASEFPRQKKRSSESAAEGRSLYDLEQVLLVEGFVTVQGSINRLGSQSPPVAYFKCSSTILFMIWLVVFGAACILWNSVLEQRFQVACTSLLYLILLVAIDIAVMETTNSTRGTALNPVYLVAIIEAGKLLVSCVLLKVSPSEREDMKPCLRDFAGFALPVVFFISNLIIILYIMKIDEASAEGTFRMTGVLWTAGIWAWVFETSLGKGRLFSLICIFLGASAPHMWSLITTTFSHKLLILCTVAFLQASTMVTTEFSMKRRPGIDINMQNMVLYACTFTASLVLALASDGSVQNLLEACMAFHGPGWVLVILQISAGVMVTRILKYNNSIVQAVVACLRGSCVLLTRLLFGFAAAPDQVVLASSMVVTVAAFSFFLQGHLHITEGTEEKPIKQAERVVLHTRKTTS